MPLLNPIYPTGCKIDIIYRLVIVYEYKIKNIKRRIYKIIELINLESNSF